jgi:ethanolamine ammonia-lyase small subunit
MIDYTVNVGHIIQILLIAGGGISALAVMRNIVATLKSDMTDMKSELRKLSEVLVILAVTSKRLDNVEEDIRDMKNGRGFINREFP